MEKGKRKGRRSSLSLSLFYGRKKKKPWQLGGSIQTSLKGSSWHNVVGEEPSCIYIYILWFLDAKLNDRRYLDRTLNESLPHEHLSDIHDYIEFENSFHLRLIILILISFLTLCLKSV